MEYKFKKTDYSFGSTPENLRSFDFGVEMIDKKYDALELIESPFWTPQNIQELIDESNALKDDKVLEYQVDGGHLGIIVTKTDGVAFFDLTNREKEEEDFIWEFDKFIQFLEDFKKFVEENS